tara:strand:- start:935 stop:1627 length:693 start_codon:yes stop_codon:yes gene_type:complete
MKLIFILIFLLEITYSKNSGWDEVLSYNAYFGGAYVANATLSSKYFHDNNIDKIMIEFKASSRSVMKYIFPINDKITIEADAKSLEPLKVEKHIREGKYSHNSISTFYKDKKLFTFNKDTISYTESLMNPYSLIYYFRNKTLNPTNNYDIKIVDNKKITPLNFKIGAKEKVSLKLGDYYTNKVWPERTDGNEFKNAGKMTIWYSENEGIPVKINLKLKFGSLNLDLEKIN